MRRIEGVQTRVQPPGIKSVRRKSHPFVGSTKTSSACHPACTAAKATWLSRWTHSSWTSSPVSPTIGRTWRTYGALECRQRRWTAARLTKSAGTKTLAGLFVCSRRSACRWAGRPRGDPTAPARSWVTARWRSRVSRSNGVSTTEGSVSLSLMAALRARRLKGGLSAGAAATRITWRPSCRVTRRAGTRRTRTSGRSGSTRTTTRDTSTRLPGTTTRRESSLGASLIFLS
mmetsp:Transcript_8725/g.39674  ORF Transcript_8725/g.39674 Transcript_8725/m.39674 type:complete len:230 (+) Transcript_8725:3696-4385(+)